MDFAATPATADPDYAGPTVNMPRSMLLQLASGQIMTVTEALTFNTLILLAAHEREAAESMQRHINALHELALILSTLADRRKTTESIQ